MKRLNILWLLLNSLFIIVFNLIFFLLGDVCAAESKIPNSVWISYGFIHFAYFLFLATPLFVRKGKDSHTYDKPLYTITAAYFIVELIAGITLILVAPETVKATIIIQAVLAAAFIAWLLIYLIANEHTAASVEHRETELQFVKQSSAQVNTILEQITDKPTAKTVEQLYDLLHGSQVKSHSTVRPLEEEILSEIRNLNLAANSNDLTQINILADKISKLTEKRNRELKLLN
ncbi:MAG: hypothetical protein FWF65_09285 [Bacteroidetes bacterium]|nr:hypothetical protein [Bacteroidota bacterium]